MRTPPLLVASLLLAVSGAASAAAAAPVTSDQFASGWQDHLRPLFNQGPGAAPATTRWYVSPMTAPGRYVLVNQDGDGKTRLIDGYDFEVPRGQPNQDIYLLVPLAYSNVSSMPASDVPVRAPARDGAR